MRIKRLILFLALILILACVLNTADAKKVKKKKTKSKPKSKPKPEKSSPKRPDGTSPELYCNVCQAICKETLKRLKHRKTEAEVFHELDSVCDPKHYYIYQFPPPEMR